MTPNQKSALEAVASRAITNVEVTAIDAHIASGQVAAIAQLLSIDRKRVVSKHISERGVRTLAVAPRARFALLDCLRKAQDAAPEWLVPSLTALGVPAEDHPAYADDLASAWRWLLSADGLDIGNTAAREMLDLIAANVVAAAPACVAVKSLAEEPDPIDHNAVSAAIAGAM